MSDFTHFNEQGNAHMVDVSEKAVSAREATASGRVYMASDTLEMIRSGGHKKGDVLAIARIAGIQGAKACSQLIPLCHPLPLSSVNLSLELNDSAGCVDISATCKLSGQTGVEMEALTAVSVAALTVYDMCKAVDKAMVIGDVALDEKKGGRSGHYLRPQS